MTFLVILAFLYFLPSLIGHNKSNAGTLFVVNLLFGWTVIGWIIVFFWACASDVRPIPVHYVPVSAGRFCSQCGVISASVARFCTGCGKTI